MEVSAKGHAEKPDAILTAGRSHDAVIRVYDEAGKSVIASVIRDVSVQIINQGFLSCCCFNQSEGLTRL
jgi:hypothetical protein